MFRDIPLFESQQSVEIEVAKCTESFIRSVRVADGMTKCLDRGAGVNDMSEGRERASSSVKCDCKVLHPLTEAEFHACQAPAHDIDEGGG